MARIKIEDLPVLEDLSPKQAKGIIGGRETGDVQPSTDDLAFGEDQLLLTAFGGEAENDPLFEFDIEVIGEKEPRMRPIGE